MEDEMARLRFKAGDRVTASMPVSEMWVEYYGTLRQPARIVGGGPGDYVIKLEKPCAKDDGEWIAVDNELAPAVPAVPDGWTPASEPEEDAPYYVEYLTMDDVDGEEQVRSGSHDLKTELDNAKVAARNSGRLVAVYRKVYEVRPGKPEVIKVEGK